MADERRFREVEARMWASLGLKPDEQFIEMERIGTRARVQSVGDGPALLLVHGGGVSGANWAPLVAELPNFRCHMLDEPGCGLSERPQDMTTFDQLNEFADAMIADCLDGLGIDRAHIIGTSLGGFMTVRGAAAHPERVDRMVQIGATFGSPMEHIPFVMRLGSVGPMPKLMARMPANRTAVIGMLKQIGLKDALASGRISEPFIDWFVANLKYTDTMLNGLALPPMIDMGGMRPEVILTDDLLSAIDTPTRFIWGDNDPMASPAVARYFVSKFPNAELELWSNCGHPPWVDHPDRAAASVTEFLAS